MIIDEFVPENIFAGNVMPVVTEKAVVASNQTVPKLAIVEKDAEGNIVVPAVIPAQGENPEKPIDPLNAYGLAAYEVITTDATQDIVLYMTGEFKESFVVLPEGKTIEDYRVPLRKLGIFLK